MPTIQNPRNRDCLPVLLENVVSIPEQHSSVRYPEPDAWAGIGTSGDKVRAVVEESDRLAAASIVNDSLTKQNCLLRGAEPQLHFGVQLLIIA